MVELEQDAADQRLAILFFVVVFAGPFGFLAAVISDATIVASTLQSSVIDAQGGKHQQDAKNVVKHDE